MSQSSHTSAATYCTVVSGFDRYIQGQIPYIECMHLGLQLAYLLEQSGKEPIKAPLTITNIDNSDSIS